AGKVGYAPAPAEPAAVPLTEAARPEPEKEKPKIKATFTSARSAYDWFVEGTRAEAAGGDEGRAATCYREALALDPGLAAARTNLGGLAYRAGDIHRAREAFEAGAQPDARDAS